MSAESTVHRWPHSSAMAAPCLEFDAANELELLYREAAWQSGQNAKTLVKFDDLRIVFMVSTMTPSENGVSRLPRRP